MNIYINILNMAHKLAVLLRSTFGEMGEAGEDASPRKT